MRVRKLLAICALMVLTGCASSGIKYTDVGAAPPRLKPGQGRVYFYRTVLIGLAIQPDIKLNGQAVGAAIPGGFFFVDRPHGSYVATATTEVESRLEFTLAAGETKYIRTNLSMGVLAGRISFELVGKPEAEADLASLNRTNVAAR